MVATFVKYKLKVAPDFAPEGPGTVADSWRFAYKGKHAEHTVELYWDVDTQHWKAAIHPSGGSMLILDAPGLSKLLTKIKNKV